MTKWYLACLLTVGLTIVMVNAFVSQSYAFALTVKQQKVASHLWEAAQVGDWQQALQIAKNSGSQDLITFTNWMYMRDAQAEPSLREMSNFLRKYPHWPLQAAIQRKAELQAAKKLRGQKAIDWFEQTKPRSTDGRTAYIRALMQAKRITQAKQQAQNLWLSGHFDNTQFANFRQCCLHLVNLSLHKKRLNHLLATHQITQARQMRGILPQSEQKILHARLALRRRQSKALSLWRSLPRAAKARVGVTQDYVYYLRKTDRDIKAVRMLLALSPKQAAQQGEHWFTHRMALMRLALRDMGAQKAYNLIARHSVPARYRAKYAEAEWSAGWIALRFLQKPEKALMHFTNFNKIVRTPISRARGLYWQGRTYQALKRPIEAQRYYKQAALYPTSFYGQMALIHAGQDNARLPSLQSVSELQRRLFLLRDLARGFQIARKMGAKEEGELLLIKLANSVSQPWEYQLLGQLASSMQDDYLLVRLGKIATKKNIILPKISYPIPKIAKKWRSKQDALALALARQESELNPQARSPVGAMGLMQLMPQTARYVAKQVALPYSKVRLTNDVPYNVKLGRWYLNTRLDDFRGQIIPALASYNAGIGRAKRWLKSYGPLQGRSLEQVIDWIELIPFPETRNYVQRILESWAVYQARLRDHAHIPLTQNFKLP